MISTSSTLLAARHLYAAFTGTVLVYYPFGAGIIMAFPPAVLTYLMMSLAPRQAGVLSWAVNFPFLIALWVSRIRTIVAVFATLVPQYYVYASCAASVRVWQAYRDGLMQAWHPAP